MTETASFAAARSTAASLPGKTLAGAAPPASITGPSSNLHSHRQSHSSSRLPSFRLADSKNAPNAAHPPPPKQPQHQQPLSPRRFAPPAASIDSHLARREPRTTRPDALSKVLASSATARNRQSLPAPEKPASPPRPSLRPRASYQTSVKTIVEQERRVRRPVSFPDGLADEAAQAKLSSIARTSSLRQSTRRVPVSRTPTANGRVTPDNPRTSLSARQPAIEDAVSPTTRVAADPKPLGLRLRTRNLPDSPASKPPSSGGPSDEHQAQPLQRPSVSYKSPVNGAATAGQSTASTTTSRVPPSRASRSSGSRHSSIDEMTYNSRSYDEDHYVDSTDDHTLRASDGDFFDQRSPPTYRHGTSGDDTGDVFMKIASEEAARHSAADNADDAKSTSQFRINRTSSRRPISQNVSSYYPMSPPSSSNRRLSDQQDRDRSRSVRYEDELTSEIARSSAYRSQLRDKTTSSRAAEDTSSRSTSSGLRPSLMTPRSTGFQDQAADSVLYGRRKSTVADTPASSSARSSAHKATVLVQNQTKTYNPSPLTRSFEMHDEDDGADAGNLAEGTESTTSTNAPSTVWDELDELKSRIHRLELTGKLPPTSAAAVMKASEERPPTAMTTLTSMSLSPRKSAAGQQTDAASTTSSQREAHSNLHSALGKIKQMLSPDVYRALETAANDALALSSMMGEPGQPGPISGSASVVGGSSGVTDRQLRRRTDSVCRSLTELCIALGEGGTSRPATGIPQVVTTQLSPNPNSQLEPPVTPTMLNTKTYSVSRRSSVVPEQATQVISSPRATSKYEERRNMILSGSSILTSPRNSASTPTTPNESISRRASLIVSRARRAVTEEAEDGRRSSALLRRRGAGDESDDGGGRRTSFLVRNRRGTVGEEDEGARFRAPSRAITEVNGGSRSMARDYLNVSDGPTPVPENTTPQPPSALSRRRFLQPSRLTVPSTSATPTTRKFLERPSADGGESGHERPSENRLSRHLSVQQHGSNHSSTYQSLQNRTSSLQFRRTSTIPASSTTATNGLR